jgi:hypothetical protein
MSRLLALLLLAVAGSAHAQDYAALFEEAAGRIDWDLEASWAFTESRLSDDTLWVARFDPRRAAGERWELLSVDGRTPTDSERREFAADKNDSDTSDSDQRLDIVGIETLELVAEDDESWLLRFVPDENEVEFIENIDATVRIVKDGRYLQSVDMRNNADIKPGWGTKIGTFLVRFKFGPAVVDGPIVPQHMKIQVGGSVLLFIGISETEVIEYRDFEPVAKDIAQ